jgi:oxalate---CoA ligase
MTTLLNALDTQSSSPALIIPNTPCSLSYTALTTQICALQATLATLGVAPSSAVTLSLPNTPEFAIAFLAIAAQRAIAVPLNQAYKQEEVEFYIDDIKAVLSLVPRGAVGKNEAAVRAARKFGVGVAEVWFQDGEVRLDVLERGKFLRRKHKVQTAETDDVAVLPPLPLADP